MQRAGGCKECASSKINPGKGVEGKAAGGRRVARGQAKTTVSALLLIPTCPKTFAPLPVSEECSQIWSSSTQEGSALDRSCVFPWTCCSAASLQSMLGLLGGSCSSHGPGTPGTSTSMEHQDQSNAPGVTVTLKGWLKSSSTEATKTDTQRPKPTLCPWHLPAPVRPGGGCGGAQHGYRRRDYVLTLQYVTA